MPPLPDAFLRVASVSKVFFAENGQPEVEVLREISFTMSRGECVALAGPPHCGRSTLLSILAGFERATSGFVSLDHEKVLEPSPDRLLISTQSSLLPWLTVEQNLDAALAAARPGHSLEQRRAAATAALETLGAATHPGTRVGDLTLVDQRLVELARALVVRPKALLMDEPFEALDARSRAQAQEALQRLLLALPETAVLLASRGIEETLLFADRVLVLSSTPVTLREQFPVTLPRPRERRAIRFQTAYETEHARIRTASEAAVI